MPLGTSASTLNIFATTADGVPGYTTPSIDFPAAQLVVAAITTRDTSAADGSASLITISGSGLTFTTRGSVTRTLGAGTTNFWRLSIFSAVTGTSTSGTLVYTPSSGQTQLQIIAGVFGYSGFNTSAPITQTTTLQGAVASTAAVTLAAFTNASNRPFAAFIRATALTGYTAEAGYTNLLETTAEVLSMFVEWNPTATDVSPSCSYTVVNANAAAGLEIGAAVAIPIPLVIHHIETVHLQ